VGEACRVEPAISHSCHFSRSRKAKLIIPGWLLSIADGLAWAIENLGSLLTSLFRQDELVAVGEL
jgi:hypothetical protein